MSEITRVGADLAKRGIQVHAVNAGGKLVTNRALARLTTSCYLNSS